MINIQDLVSAGNLQYDEFVPKHELGMPVGNGRMGSLLWLHRAGLIGYHYSKIDLQINRTDVFGFNSYSGIPNNHHDYCGGCGSVKISFSDEAFLYASSHQCLDIYNGEVRMKGDGIELFLVAEMERDCMVFVLEDRRAKPTAVSIDLAMLRASLVKTGRHTAESKLEIRGGRMILEQVFSEPSVYSPNGEDHYCATAVAIGVAGRRSEVRRVSPSKSRIVVEGQNGRFAIIIASASSMDQDDDVMQTAIDNIDITEAAGIERLRGNHRAWWHDFWSQSYVYTPSNQEFMKLWTYYLYLSACTMRGRYPAKFNGQIWDTKGDTRAWGGRYWWWNQGCMHSGFFAANHIELNDPLFDMRTGAYKAYAKAAEQDWGSKGIYIPETGTFNGPEELPEDIAGEIRNVFLDRHLPSEKLKAIRDCRNTHESRWSWADPNIPIGWVSHVLVVAAKTADLVWRRFEFTRDKAWLSQRAYPTLRGAAEFYTHYPNLITEDDGKYHLHNTSLHEHLWGCKDSIDDLSLMRGVLATATRAAELLDVDAVLREEWLKIADSLAPYPTNSTEGALGVLNTEDGVPTFAQAVGPTYKNRGLSGSESPRLRLLEEFDLLTLESENTDLWRIAMSTFDAHPGFAAYKAGEEGSETSRLPVIAARLGRADAVEVFLPLWLKHWTGRWETPNGLPEKEGPQAFSVQGYGIFCDALQQSLCQSVCPAPGGKPTIRVFPAWPRKWDAAFKLLCKGGFLVASSIENGLIQFVEIDAQIEGECRIRNPWFPEKAVVTKNGVRIRTSGDSLLCPMAEKGDTYRLERA